jgi:PilZ domain-containing protein
MDRAAPESPAEDVPPEPVFRKIRISFIQRATLTHDGGVEDVFTIDLGVRGVFVERSEPLPPRALVSLRFRLPGNELPIVARCRVAWWHGPQAPLKSKQLPSGLGLEFTEIEGGGAARVRAYLSEYLRRNPRNRRFNRRPDGEEEDET